MAITRYAQVAVEQVPFANFPGGGMTNQGAAAPFAQFNDPSIEIGDVREVTAIYQLQGNEAACDIINIYLAQPGTMLDPAYSNVSQRSPATTLTLTVGDDDTTGVGLVTGLNQNARKRYANVLNAATGQSNPIPFTGGDALTDPYMIGATAQESNPNGGTVSGSWIQAVIETVGTPVAGGCLIFRLRLIKP